MSPRDRRFEVIHNPLTKLERQLLALEQKFTSAGIKFYGVGEVPEGAQPVWFFEIPEKIYVDGSELRQEYDDSMGEGGWAVTPHVRADGEVLVGLVDIVTTVNPDRLLRLKLADKGRRDLARPALRIIKGGQAEQD